MIIQCPYTADDFDPAISEPFDFEEVLEVPAFPTVESLDKEIASIGRALWTELFTEQSITPEWLADWEARIPNYGCSCAAKYHDWKRDNPPPVFASTNAWFDWKITLYNYVRRSLSREEIDVATAHQWWPSSS